MRKIGDGVVARQVVKKEESKRHMNENLYVCNTCDNKFVLMNCLKKIDVKIFMWKTKAIGGNKKWYYLLFERCIHCASNEVKLLEEGEKVIKYETNKS